jgi:hypothetical protein
MGGAVHAALPPARARNPGRPRHKGAASTVILRDPWSCAPRCCTGCCTPPGNVPQPTSFSVAPPRGQLSGERRRQPDSSSSRTAASSTAYWRPTSHAVTSGGDSGGSTLASSRSAHVSCDPAPTCTSRTAQANRCWATSTNCSAVGGGRHDQRDRLTDADVVSHIWHRGGEHVPAESSGCRIRGLCRRDAPLSAGQRDRAGNLGELLHPTEDGVEPPRGVSGGSVGGPAVVRLTAVCPSAGGVDVASWVATSDHPVLAPQRRGQGHRRRRVRRPRRRPPHARPRPALPGAGRRLLPAPTITSTRRSLNTRRPLLLTWAPYGFTVEQHDLPQRRTHRGRGL